MDGSDRPARPILSRQARRAGWKRGSGSAKRSVTSAALAATVLAAACLPAAAQQASTPPQRSEAASPAPDAQDPTAIAVGVNQRRSRLYAAGNIAAAAALYTRDASYVELMPILQAFRGRAEISGHLEDLVAAAASSIVPSVTDAVRNPDGTILVTGSYVVVTRYGPEAEGHFVQTLRHEDGTWRIAMHAFARPDPITGAELDAQYGD